MIEDRQLLSLWTTNIKQIVDYNLRCRFGGHITEYQAKLIDQLDLLGVPWNFADEGHMHKVALWLGIVDG